MSGDRSFLDTNIFVNAVDEDDLIKARRAQKLIAEAAGSAAGFISYQVVQEFVNVVSRQFPRPVALSEIQRLFETVFRSLTIVHSSMPLFTLALSFQDRYGLSWYDSLIVAAAVEANCSTLYSEDFQDGQRFGLTRVRNPFR